MLANWRGGVWSNQNISKSLHLSKLDTDFPSPDGCFFAPQTKMRIAMEFKPGDRETQRGLLTGIGQCVAYLNKHSAAYLVAPDSVSDNTEIGDYLEKTFKKSIYGKIPVGLITYSAHDFDKLILRCDIAESLVIKPITGEGVDVNYWAAWRDTPPHAIYFLLKIAEELKDTSDRSKKIWDKFYFTHYVVKGSTDTLADIPSTIKMWDGVTYQIPLSGIKHTLRQMVSSGETTEAEALGELDEKTNPGISDNNYHDIKKNHYNFVNHLLLWNSEQYLTDYGKRLVKIGDEHGGDSEEFKSYLGYMMLDVGRHVELIEDMKHAIANSSRKLDDIDDVKSVCYDYLESKGYIKVNPNRTTTGVRKAFVSEFGVWGHFGILNKIGQSFFDAHSGLSFNEQRIKELMDLGKDNQ